MLRVLVAEDMRMIRGALVALLDLEPDIMVVSEVERGDEIVGAALACRPDVAVVDLNLPGIDGLRAAVDLREQLPECHTLLLTSVHRPGIFRSAMEAGVSGFLRKDAPPEHLASAIRRLTTGERVLDAELSMAAWQRCESPLTPRETECLRLIGQGLEVSAIATHLHLSVGTVRNYLTFAVAKLQARNRIHAVSIATEAEWI